jgi:hypothetical protein
MDIEGRIQGDLSFSFSGFFTGLGKSSVFEGNELKGNCK